MIFIVVCSVAFVASLLTFFTGFGLGTLLLPAFAGFFAVEVAVALTAVVHLLNSLFKLVLVGSHVNGRVVARFGIPAMAASFVGALVLASLAYAEPLWAYQLNGRTYRVMPVALVVALLMLTFAALELWPWFKRVGVPARYLPLGGLVTGFFGGVSGHQGALRSAFLVRLGLGKEAFIATGVVIAAMVDVTRLAVYSERFLAANLADHGALIGAAVLAAFAGAIVGYRVLAKVSLRVIEGAVAVLLALVAVGLGSGLL